MEGREREDEEAEKVGAVEMVVCPSCVNFASFEKQIIDTAQK